MTIDELIQKRADELRSAYADRILTTNPRPAAPTGVRPSGIGVLAAAILGVLLLFAPVALLLRITPSPGTGPEDTVAGSAASTYLRPVYHHPKDQGLGAVMDSGGDLVVAGWRTVLASADGGETWRETGGSPDEEEALVEVAAGDGVLVAVCASDGTGARLYRSSDLGASWELVALPGPEGPIGVVSMSVAHHDSGFLVAGVGTTETHVQIFLWTSPDGTTWHYEAVADMGGEFVYMESVQLVDDTYLVLARTSADTAPGVLAFERSEGTNTWAEVDLTSLVPPGSTNLQLAGTGVVDGRFHAWWRLDNGFEDSYQSSALVTRRTGPADWEAEIVRGVAPETVTVAEEDGRLLGTAHPGEIFPYLTPGFTAVVSSTDGAAWEEVTRFDGVALGRLTEIAPGRFLTAGSGVREEDGYVNAASSGIWRLDLLSDFP